MKKVYVRPTIEIENFEANEYVAACYTITCTSCGHGSFISKNVQPTLDNNDRDGDGFGRGVVWGDGSLGGSNNYYTGTINGSAGNLAVWKSATKTIPGHLVSVTSGTPGAAGGPNISN